MYGMGIYTKKMPQVPKSRLHLYIRSFPGLPSTFVGRLPHLQYTKDFVLACPAQNVSEKRSCDSKLTYEKGIRFWWRDQATAANANVCIL